MKLGDIVRALSSTPALVLAAVDALRENVPPLVEEGSPYQEAKIFLPERTFRISGTGVRFVRNMPQGLASVG